MGELARRSVRGVDTSDATATAADIARGKTAYVKGEKIAGTATIPVRTYVTVNAPNRATYFVNEAGRTDVGYNQTEGFYQNSGSIFVVYSSSASVKNATKLYSDSTGVTCYRVN